jgi:large subunit ribosomal protein L18
MHSTVDRKANRARVRYRIRKKFTGTATRPRLAVFRSLKHIYAQAIDDETGRTLAAASSVDRELRSTLGAGGSAEAAKQVGAKIGERLRQAGIEAVVFDRGGFVYHGRIRALADAVREAGLKL